MEEKLSNEELKEIKKDIERYQKITNISKSEGGKVIIAELGNEIVSIIDILCCKYKTASHIELITMIARLNEKLKHYREFSRAEENMKESKEEYAKCEENLKDLLA